MTSQSDTSLTSELYNGFAVCLILLLITGLVGQLIGFTVFLQRDHRSKELNCFLLNICVANSLALVLQFSLELAACLLRGWNLGTTACYVSGLTSSVTGFVMITTLSYMCVKIYHHIIARDLVTSTNQLNQLRDNGSVAIGGWKVLLSTWGLGIALLLPTPLGWGSIAPQAGGTTCAPNWSARTIANSSYLMVLVLVGFITPLCVSFLYLVKIYRYTTQHPPGLQTEGFSFQYVRARNQHVAAAKVISMEVLVYFLVWLPYWVCGIITLLGGAGGRGTADGGRGASERSKGAAVVPWLLAHVGPVYFPYIYAAMNNRFRRTMSHLVVGCFTKKRQVTPTINVDHIDKSEVSDSTAPCSPRLIPRSPLTNRAFQLPQFEEITLNELATPRPKPQRKFHFALEAITKFMRTSLDRLDINHAPADAHARHHRRVRRNTTEI